MTRIRLISTDFHVSYKFFQHIRTEKTRAIRVLLENTLSSYNIFSLIALS